MTRYQLAKLILMAGGLDSRKRVQKTVHLLQAAGCPLEVEFRLHYYGPYSRQLAELLDRMSANEIIFERPESTQLGVQFNYRLNEQMRTSLESYELTADGQAAKDRIERYGELLKTLCDTRARVLELASTIVAFRETGAAWENALDEAAAFKSERTGTPLMTEACELAQKVVDYEDD